MAPGWAGQLAIFSWEQASEAVCHASGVLLRSPLSACDLAVAADSPRF